MIENNARLLIMGLLLNTQFWDRYTNAAIKRALVQAAGALYRIRSTSLMQVLLVVLPVVAHWATELRAHDHPPAAVMHQAILKVTKSSITEFLGIQIDEWKL
jgi:hypothetical protein